MLLLFLPLFLLLRCVDVVIEIMTNFAVFGFSTVIMNGSYIVLFLRLTVKACVHKISGHNHFSASPHGDASISTALPTQVQCALKWSIHSIT